ncbi:brain acid soluble protein 1 homolog [Impatiens glandulifera]|uniref:brain acid soluble protein 1 homolog n=1 Tax=Impatiens glandulifera TaxID=253017 RepID=UPI001FB13148|nr:brain acid soluble protein 1 homolog [Impatiens glandulifera]
MSEKTDKTVKPKSSRTKSSKGTSSSAPAEECSKREKPKRKAVQAEASQQKNGRKKSSAKKSSSKLADSEKTLSSDKSPKRTEDVFQPIPINTVRPISIDSQSPRQTEPSGATKPSPHQRRKQRETEDDVSSRLKLADQGEIPDQRNKSAPKDTTTQLAQDGPAASTILPEGPVQDNKGKGVL